MKCAIRFCGGCNPRYERGQAYRDLKAELSDIDFLIANEADVYDCLLVIGGCTSCCASYEQFNVKGEVIKMWDRSHYTRIRDTLLAMAEQEDD